MQTYNTAPPRIGKTLGIVGKARKRKRKPAPAKKPAK